MTTKLTTTLSSSLNTNGLSCGLAGSRVILGGTGERKRRKKGKDERMREEEGEREGSVRNRLKMYACTCINN